MREVLNGGGALQACRRGGMEFGSSGDALQVCSRRRIEVWSSVAREARCGRVGMEFGSFRGALQAVQTWRYGDRDLWRCAADVQMWRRVAGLGRWRCRGMEIWSSGATLQA